MKILYIHDYPFKEGGGIEVQTNLDALELSKRGHDVTIASTRISSETYSKVIVPAESIIEYCYIESEESLVSLITNHDIVSIQATFSLRDGMINALRILNQIGKKHVVCLRTSINHIPFSRLATLESSEKENLLNQFSDYLNSDLCSIQTVSNCFKPSLDFLNVTKKFTTIYNAKDWGQFLSHNESIKPVTLTYVGEISWMKGLHVLLSVIPYLTQKIPSLTIRIIGNGQDKQQVASIIECSGFTNVELVDYIENQQLASYLSATKIVVVPSLTETWCNLAMEALSVGAPIVASDVEGLSELLEQGKLGTTFQVGNAIDMAEKILQTINSSKQDSHAKYVQGKYSMNNRIRLLEQFYNTIIGPEPEQASKLFDYENKLIISERSF